MKFGNTFNFHKVVEWSQFYLDYNYLKKILKEYKKSYLKSKKSAYLILVTTLRKQTSTRNNLSLKQIASVSDGLINKDFTSEEDSYEFNFEDISKDRDKFIEEYKIKVMIVENFFLNKLKELTDAFNDLQNKFLIKKNEVK